jgi:hypothetical protein
MKKQSGIWIDTKKAVIVRLIGKVQELKIVHSFIEGRERVPGEKKMLSRFNYQFSNYKSKKENRDAHEIHNYLKQVVDEIKGTDEVVIFGPAQMKIKLEKYILDESSPLPAIRRVEAKDDMTENEIVALVKNFFSESGKKEVKI